MVKRVGSSRSATWFACFAALALFGYSCSEDSSPTSAPPPPVLRVSPDGSGDVPTIQAAIDSLPDGGVVELADGVFTGDGNRDLALVGKAITIRSGSGDADRCILDCAADTLDWHRAILIRGGGASNSILEALTITRGCAPYGGAIYCDSSASPRIVRCAFRLNVAIESGGAVLCSRRASPSFVECEFDANRATGLGGGVCAFVAAPSFLDCVFEGGQAELGGGFAADGDCDARFTRCRFLNHWARFGGAVYCRDTGVIFEYCTFGNNGCRWCGAGIYCYFGAYPLIDHCTFFGNHSTCGAAISSDQGSHAHLTHCTLFGNSGERAGGVECDAGGTAIIQDTIIAGSTSGVGVHCRDEESRIYLQRCDLFGNEAGDWVGCAESQRDLDGNVSADPMFCDPQAGVFTLRRQSACAGREVMGAWGVGCE